MFGDMELVYFIRINILKWISHVNRMCADRITKRIFNNQPEGNGRRGRPTNHWLNFIQPDLKERKMFGWKIRPIDRDGWKRSRRIS